MADQDDLYDEFGNYIGPDLESDEEEEYFEDELAMQDDAAERTHSESIVSHHQNLKEQRIILAEDKKYYPDADELYPGVKAVTLEEDAQKLSEPIIKPIKVKNFSSVVSSKDADLPKFKYSIDFMATLMNTPTLIRSIAIIGHLHHGKTLFVDTLVQATLEQEADPKKEMKFTDTRLDEQHRLMSIKSTYVSLILENLKSKSYLINLIDCPGHVNFSDETTAALRLVDGAVIVVDAVEGVMLNTERLIRHAVAAQVSLHLVINKVDRLILELKLPPQDAYYKIQHTIEEVNKIIASMNSVAVNRLSPELGNVTFASGLHGWSFTLKSFSETYSAKYQGMIDAEEFSKRLWGDWYHNEVSGSFSRKKPDPSAVRTFVSFVLEPLYKLYSQVIGEEPEALQRSMKRVGVILRNKEIHLDPQPLLKLCLSRYFANPKGFVDAIVNHFPSPIDGADAKIKLYYTGYQTSDIASDMRSCKANSNLVANVAKLYNSPDGSKFWALARIFAGSIDKGQKIRVLGEGYSMDDEEDMVVTEVTSISIGIGRHYVEISSAIAGNLVLLEGIDASIKKTATLTDMELEDLAIFKPLSFNNTSTFKVAVEPLNPSVSSSSYLPCTSPVYSYRLLLLGVTEDGRVFASYQ
jgi:116 kDa U5 small nuclear ribonucleoprotein component